MTNIEMIEIIRKRHKYLQDPSIDELNAVLNELVVIENQKGYVTNQDLDIALNKHIIHKRELLNESEDLSTEINLAQQILDKIRK